MLAILTGWNWIYNDNENMFLYDFRIQINKLTIMRYEKYYLIRKLHRKFAACVQHDIIRTRGTSSLCVWGFVHIRLTTCVKSSPAYIISSVYPHQYLTLNICSGGHTGNTFFWSIRGGHWQLQMAVVPCMALFMYAWISIDMDLLHPCFSY